MSMITISSLIKKYDKNVSVDNINLNIDKGELFGLLGPNGAGKTTTINMICGLLKPTGGEILIDGIGFKENELEYKSKIGLVPQEIAIYETLSAYENVKFFAKLSGLRGKLLEERVKESLDFVGLYDKRSAVPGTFSGGMKRRLNIACAIPHHPKVVIMDEPTVGIDPQSRNHILESVRELNRMGSTVVYTSHYMEEIEALCTRIAIIDHGKLIALGTKEELKKLLGTDETIIFNAAGVNNDCLKEIKELRNVKEVKYNNNTLEIITNNPQAILQDILNILSGKSIKIKGMNMMEADLETVFLSLTGRTLRD